ncbi:MAG: DNA integrity scanning diadenylate cyclase DisA [Candidatus Nanoarchaeia archaeon]|nr:DNA integrity scanning diadenylate cyclase DisA [Candidatus Nanoarchaeia archaeon]MDD5357776.1 DNA integrity scanning diadenylate cyclase DisA [Candidatus Nanoarchaeia archaeon]MDD5588695.1 DNA integrity scanning diadenylate cyclase DisA [Candidatus Nanoarchaeia archaeon]
MEEEKKEIQVRLVEGKKEVKKEEITDILKIISPGTSIRSAVEGIQKAKTGGLIVAYNEFTENIFEGGFKINSRVTPQRLIELSKMDGAIILSKDLKKILHANVLLTPNNSIASNETGTRHKAAERTAKQAETVVITVSQRRDEIALFYKNIKYVIRSTSDIIRRATEVLQILEKHKEVFEKNKNELDREELKKRPALAKSLLLIQRGIMIIKISETLKGYIIELGAEGTIVKSRLKEILYRVEKEIDDVIRDYTRLGLSRSKKILSVLSYDELLELENIKQCLGLSEDSDITSKGHRTLGRAGISEKEAGTLIKNFKNLVAILELKKEDLIPFFEEEKINEMLEKISHLKE